MIRLSTRLWLAVAAALRRIIGAFDASDLALAFMWFGLAMVAVPLAFVVTGALLLLVTPIGVALRILIRGH